MFFVKMIHVLCPPWCKNDAAGHRVGLIRFLSVDGEWVAERESAKKFDTRDAAGKIAAGFPGAFVVVE